nr:hypothetical protein [Picornavirus ishikawaense]
MYNRVNSYILNNPTLYGGPRQNFANNSLLLNGSFNKEHDFQNANALNFQSYDNHPSPPPYTEREATGASTLENAQETSKAFEGLGNIAGMSVMGAGMGAAGIDSAINDANNAKIMNAARTGNGPNGHAFDAMTHAENQVAFNNAHESFRSSALMLGSSFGPEGLLGAGILSAADYAVQAMTSPSENTTNSTSGAMINASTIN